jgi:hypothetical protein
MMRCKPLAAVFVLVGAATAARAGGWAAPKPTVDAAALLDADSTAALAGNLRAALIQDLPTPLYEDDRHWGGQKWCAHGVTWRGKGLHVHADVTKTLRNDGRWWKARVTADDPADTLVLDLRDVRPAGPGRTTFTAFLAFDAHVLYDQENWDDGVRLYAGSVRARMRVKLTLHCEATAKLEPGGSVLPDAVFRLRVLAADLRYDNFVTEHAAGVGGEAAKLLGEAIKDGVEQLHPSLERHLLEKADAALVKAGDTKEVRVSVMKLLKAK